MKVKRSSTPQQGGTTPAKRGPCTWEELSTHNSKEDCWVAFDGRVYDVTSWIPKHPGGTDVLALSAGRDITNTFESYHPFSGELTTSIIKKYYVCDIADSELPKYITKSPLYDTLRQRVGDYFKQNNIDHKNSFAIYSRIAFIYFLVFATYYLANFVTFNSIFLTILMAIAYGSAEALFSMHVLHDTSHCSISHTPPVWRYIGVTFDFLIGGSYFAWLHQHTIGHHLYTNVRGADPDLGEGDVDFRRISPAQQWRPLYKYQHIYAPLLYGLLTFKARVIDSDTFISRVNGRIRVLNPSMFHIITYLMGKVAFIVFRLVLPLFVISLGRLMLTFFITEFVMGYYLALVFQVSHIATGLDFMATPLPPAPASKIDEDWAISQIRTTQDYGHGDKFTTFMTGALNYQVVHHLFPSISQNYLPNIAPIVIQTCKEFGVDYHVLPHFGSALWSHIDYLRIMGKDPNEPRDAQEKKKANNRVKAA
jgi:fatty acid desaturase/predicted heme/steroid binding protein